MVYVTNSYRGSQYTIQWCWVSSSTHNENSIRCYSLLQNTVNSTLNYGKSQNRKLAFGKKRKTVSWGESRGPRNHAHAELLPGRKRTAQSLGIRASHEPKSPLPFAPKQLTLHLLTCTKPNIYRSGGLPLLGASSCGRPRTGCKAMPY